MRFSNNGATWSTAATYATSTAWNLNNPSYGGTSADGSKTAYAQFKDTVGNWSTAVISRSIILDSVVPTGTITINNLATTTTSTNVTLSLTCNDATSGCSTMEFANDGGGWSVPEVFNATKSWSLQSTNGTRTVNVRYTDAAGKQSNYSDTIILDSTGPVTTANNKTNTYLSAVGVKLTCVDALSTCVNTYYTVSSSPTATPTDCINSVYRCHHHHRRRVEPHVPRVLQR